MVKVFVGGPGVLRITDEEIRAVCAYIADDRKIAQSMGVDEYRVTRVRKNMPKVHQRSIKIRRKATDGTVWKSEKDIRSGHQVSCDAHLKALIRLGWKQGGLPGLTDAMFTQLAKDKGISRG